MEASEGAPGAFAVYQHRIGQQYQLLLDKLTPHTLQRWIGLGIFVLIYALRVFTLSGFYIVTYALGIFLLNLLISFLSPSLDPALELDMDDAEGEGATLPKSSNDEFRPFIRRLPEFKFWLKTLQAFLIAFVCTFLPFMNIPVFWPILVLYFLILFFMTMRKQIRHMIKYRYIPFNIGKKAYKGRS